MIAAVNGDKWGGLTGYKRPLQSNPTRVPNNLPASRAAPNTPGAPIKAPAIKSSAAHPDRKTNVCIPYARLCPLDNGRSLGRVAPGDVLFVGAGRPEVPTQTIDVTAVQASLKPGNAA